MITNVHENDIKKASNKRVIALFHNNHHKFWLTGSRYFGGSSSYSDYDFFAKNCDTIKSWLIANGFVKLGAAYHPEVNQNVAEVWGLLNAVVHVQLVDDPELKHKIQLAIKACHVNMSSLTRHIGKENTVGLWNLFYWLTNIRGSTVTGECKEDVDCKLKQLIEENDKLRKALEDKSFKSSELYDIIG